MFFILSKIVYWVAMPLSISCLLLIISIVVTNGLWKKRLRRSGIFCLLLFSNPLIATLSINAWEPNAKLYTDFHDQYDWGVVLAGITNPDRHPYDRIQFNKGADRIVHAIDLYKLGKVKKLLISGGSGILTFEGEKESHALADFARSCGVLSEDIIIEDKSRNTRENASYSSELIEENETVLLFTSAFHMKRAMGCFNKLSVKTTAFPTDYYGNKIRFSPDEVIVPKHQSFQIWSILIKEWIGLVAYKLAGYI